MRIAFFGTAEFSASILETLINDYSDDIDVELVVSQPDKHIGRKRILEKTAIKKIAEKNNIECLQPEKLRISNKSGQTQDLPLQKNCRGGSCVHPEDFYKKLNSLDLDFIVVVAYGKIVPKEVLEAPKYGCINIHGSILPAYRGASPIQESIKNGDKNTGLTIMYMSAGMDEGDILAVEKIEIGENDKATDLFRKFENIGPDLLASTLKGILYGKIKGKKQNDTDATYCSKIKKEDGKIDFTKETGDEIYNKFRAYYPWPGIYSYFNGKKINFEEIEIRKCPTLSLGEGSVDRLDKKTIGILCKNNKILILKQVKLEGKKSMDILSFVNGNKDFLDYNFS